uniref:RING-type E3 ubiquitin transferase n=1 Tax=Ciona intestinalis TaxID=7719 RepID=F6RDJ3_CIOIN|nr:E3 ubiquitin-protein ligase MARCH4-like [Ciona intestinalis]|eukprot:XP_002126878.1 E3 ubiquitin-protein ligase MARCH4-like [Ciona intestinalis]
MEMLKPTLKNESYSDGCKKDFCDVTGEMMKQGQICRICQEADGSLITPCRCKGTIGFVHEACLVQWLSKSGKSMCEICHTSYVLRVKNSENIRWKKLCLTRHDLAMIAVNFVCILFLISTTSWLVWSAVSSETRRQRNSDLFRACYALYGFMDMFCLGILLHEIPHMRLMYRRYKLMQYELRVMPQSPATVITVCHQENLDNVQINLPVEL